MISPAVKINSVLKKHEGEFHPVVSFDASIDNFAEFDFTASNLVLTKEIVSDTTAFSSYINSELQKKNARYGIGGFMEHRTVYSRSAHFNTENEPRRLHLGVDIWGQVNTPVFSFIDGQIHSFAYNNNFGDYGATIIMEHQLDDVAFFALYGHLSIRNLEGIKERQLIKKGEKIGDFGNIHENGHWPPHLHFQIICSMDGLKGDYPGVAKFSEKDYWLKIIPDPNIILKFH